MAQGAVTKVKKRKKSVIKRAKQSRVRAAVNRANTTRVRVIIKKLKTAIAAKDATSAISKGVMEENTGNRYKSRLSLAINRLHATAKA